MRELDFVITNVDLVTFAIVMLCSNNIFRLDIERRFSATQKILSDLDSLSSHLYDHIEKFKGLKMIYLFIKIFFLKEILYTKYFF
jgi:hypothetical protein